jgi:3-oxoadipate enol-lactonase
MPEATVNNVRLSYRDSGGGAAPLLLLHGLGSSGQIWDGLALALTPAHRVIAPDLRGHGASAKPRGGYSVRLLADDVAALLDHLGVEAAAVCGLSMGGAIAQTLAVDHRARVRALVLEDTWGYPTPAFAAALGARIQAVREHGLAHYAEAAIPQVFSERFRAANPQALDDYRARNAQLDPEAIQSVMRGLVAFDPRGRLATVRVPTLVVVGSEDRLTPRLHAEYLHRVIPGSRLEVVEGAGHIPHLEAPAVFTRLLLDFLRDAG